MTQAVLSLCDQTGNMVKPWVRAGYDAWIVDTQHRAGAHRFGRIVRVGTMVERFLPPRDVQFVAAFAFPPCTDLTNSGNAHKRHKGLLALAGALKLVGECMQVIEWLDVPYLLENPVGAMSGIAPYLSKPDHYFDPCDYGGYLDPPGDKYTKKTCLWTGGGLVMSEPRRVEPERVCSQGSFLQKLGGKSEKTKKARSATPMGFAQAIYEANK